jgi:hypothetical protein
MALTVPTRCSLRRGIALSGLGRTALTPLMQPKPGYGSSLIVADLEHLIGRAITLEDWDRATLRISHESMEAA